MISVLFYRIFFDCPRTLLEFVTFCLDFLMECNLKNIFKKFPGLGYHRNFYNFAKLLMK